MSEISGRCYLKLVQGPARSTLLLGGSKPVRINGLRPVSQLKPSGKSGKAASLSGEHL